MNDKAIGYDHEDEIEASRAPLLDHLIELRKRDKDWNEDGARKQLLQFFEAWGVMDPDTIRGRRKLSALLFS